GRACGQAARRRARRGGTAAAARGGGRRPAGARSRGRGARRRPGRAGAAVAVRQPHVGPRLPPPPLRLRPPDRGLQARARARLRLLRAAAPARRAVRRPRGREGRPSARGAPGEALHARARRAPPARRAARTRRDAARARARARSRRAVTSARGLRDPRNPRRPGAGSGHRRGDHADLPDLDVRAGGRGQAQGLRLLARREPDAHGIAFASGLGATTTIMHLVDPGERVVLIADVYGGVYRMTSQVYEPKGYRFTYVPAAEFDENLSSYLGEDVRLVWVETPSNPLLNVVDIRAAARAAHDVGALLVVDNTFATPYLQQPLDLGADAVVHSTTK